MTKDRNYRNFEVRALEEGMIVEGYAVVFNRAEVMYEFDGIEYKEQVDKNAFNGAQMSDVVLNYNHDGKPFARTKNGTLSLNIDDYGLKIKADLSGSEEGRRTWEEVKNGLLDKMSFAFTINSEEYDSTQRLRTIKGIKRLFDVSIVDLPAYEATSVSARGFFEDTAQKELFIARKNELARKKQELKTKLN
jgi:HK97 family phage prohead protease